MNRVNNAVFLSYASQDAEAAKRICEALRAAGVEVWFDQNELVGGDAWDAKIRGQIAACALFVPIISANTQARREGYFRLEWRVATERMRHMDDDLPFLVPVVIDDTKDADAFVPERFREVQWTRLPNGEASPAFAQRMLDLVGENRIETRLASQNRIQPDPPSQTKTWAVWPWIAAALILALAGGFVAWWQVGAVRPNVSAASSRPVAKKEP